MAPQKRPSTTRLPQSLRDEIDAQTSTTSSGRGRKPGPHNRKAERKAERQLAKQRKAQFFSHGVGKSSSKRSADIDPRDNINGPPRKKAKLQSPTEVSQAGEQNAARATKERTTKDSKEIETVKAKERMGKSTPTKTLKDADWDTKEKRSRREEEEDAYMEMLEKQLGVNNKKKGKSKYGAGFEGDGLLDLLLDLDEKLLENGDDDLEKQLDMNGSSDDENENSELDSSEESDQKLSDDNGEEEEEEEEEDWSGFTSEVSNDEEEEGVAAREEGLDDKSNAQSSGSRYIPPQLRKQLAATNKPASEVDAKLVRLLKGLLNRLSEQNIESVLKEVESLYRSYKRHDITEALTNLIVEGTCSHSILLDAYVALHAGLVACLHKIIGVELAAYFVQSVVANFERHYAKSREPHDSASEPSTKVTEIGKECSNLLVLLSDLYNYHIISCTLMYDVIRLILEGDLTELDVELILKLARGSGAQLRQDDPSALKDIIQIVQSKLGDQRNSSSRTRFMVETLNNLKNNKLKKNTAGAQGGSESKERISKFVSGIGKKYHVHAHEPLRISLDDLHQADSKGKWWLVGAAWGGDPLLDRQASRTQSSTKQTSADAENALMKLARKQGMNTDVRRSVFVVLMSSDDYVDACDRLAQLNLTEVQQREIIRVLLHCCGNEKSYNPYYTLIAQHLCRQTHSYRVTLQYCFWDFLRSLGETNVGGADMAKSFEDEQKEDDGFELDRVSNTRMANVARAYAWWVAKDCLAITILKTLDFIALKNKTKTFLKHFFTQLFICTQDPSPVPNLSSSVETAILAKRDDKALVDILLKATRLPVLARGIAHFLSFTFNRADSQDPTEVFMQWGCEVAKDVLQGEGGDLQ